MTDVFISYCSKDRDVAGRLAAALQSRSLGKPLEVWWDRSLVSGDDYWRVIARHLDEARAAIVLWSDNALNSDWVYAEACRAKRMRKVVPVSITGRLTERPPMPFDVLHTVPLGDPVADLPAIIDGIEARLAGKPYRVAFGRDPKLLDAEVLDAKREPMPQQAFLAPADLLKARYQHDEIAFDDVHGLLTDLVAWARRPAEEDPHDRSALGCLIHAAGGYGKTRLLIEVVDQLQKEGWLAGFVPRGVVGGPREAVLQRLIDHGEDAAGLMLVVDYVEQRTVETQWIAERLAARSGRERRPSRLVMLARGAGEWWPDWLDRSSALQRLLVTTRVPKPGYDVRQMPRDIGKGDRVAMFDSAHMAFCRLTRQPVRRDLPPALIAAIEQDPRLTRPLAMQMTALLCAYGYDETAAGTDLSDLLGKIVGLEKDHWERALKLSDGDRNLREALGRATAAATLCQGIGGADRVRDLLARDRVIASMNDIDVPRLCDLMAKLYPREDGGVAPLEPDLIGEHLVARTADEAIVEAALATAGRDAELQRGIVTVLVRATRGEHGIAAGGATARIEHLIRTRAALVPELTAVLAATPGRLIERLGEEPLALLDGALPLQAVSLMELSLEVAERRLALARSLSPVAGGAGPPDSSRQGHLAARFGTLGIRLSNLGRREDALAASQEAVDIYRALAKDRPDAFLPDLATSLNNTGAMLSNLGRREDALAASQEAVDIRRALAKDRPDAFLPDLAMSLSVMSDALRALGRAGEGANATREGLEGLLPMLRQRTEIFRGLAEMLAREHLEVSEEAGREPDSELLSEVSRVLGFKQEGTS